MSKTHGERELRLGDSLVEERFAVFVEFGHEVLERRDEALDIAEERMSVNALKRKKEDASPREASAGRSVALLSIRPDLSGVDVDGERVDSEKLFNARLEVFLLGVEVITNCERKSAKRAANGTCKD